MTVTPLIFRVNSTHVAGKLSGFTLTHPVFAPSCPWQKVAWPLLMKDMLTAVLLCQDFQADLTFVHCLSSRCFLKWTGSQVLATRVLGVIPCCPGNQSITLLASLSNNTRSFSGFFFFCFFFFLGPHLWHMAVPSLGVESEPKLPATATAMRDPSCIHNL